MYIREPTPTKQSNTSVFQGFSYFNMDDNYL
jgi:hypothetical protein